MALLSLAIPVFAAHAATAPGSSTEALAPLRFCLATLEHDHAWWTMDHIRETPGVELVGVFDRQAHLREKARKRLTNSVPLFGDLEKMIKECKPDALIVTAPNNEHRALAELAAQHRIHCLVQKPMATTAADARAMQKAAAAAGITLMVNYYPLWQPTRHELLTRAKAGEIGDVQQMTVINGMQGPRDMNVLTPDYRKWLYNPERNGGNVIGDQVTYGLDYVLWVMGRPESVVATITPIKQHDEGVDDLATLTLSYPRGQAVVIASWAWPHPRGELFCAGSRGSLTLRDKDIVRRNSPERFNTPVEETVIQPSATIPPERKHGIAYFAHALRNKLPVEEPHSAELNVLVCEVVDAARESARTGRRVTFADIDGPKCDRFVIMDDVEHIADKAALDKKYLNWNSKAWEFRLDPDNKRSGRFGVTLDISRVAKDKLTSWFTFTETSMTGMNALRMWIKPDGSNARVSMFVQDAREGEIWVWDLKDMLAGTEPYVLQIPFAQFSRVFRPKNRVFDAESCKEWGFWIWGPCRFSVDDILFVHDPSLPDFDNHKMETDRIRAPVWFPDDHQPRFENHPDRRDERISVREFMITEQKSGRQP